MLTYPPRGESSDGAAYKEKRGVDYRVEGTIDWPLVHQLSREGEDQRSRGSTEDRHGSHSKQPRREPVDDSDRESPCDVKDLIEKV